jgi:hypothetical protein
MDSAKDLNTIDIVMPTMWMVPGIVDNLSAYCNCSSIGKIILIDNNPTQRPDSSIFTHDKIELISYGRNIYVNPAWNEGYYRSTADVMCILNDDIFVEDAIWYMMTQTDFSDIDVIGVNLQGAADNHTIMTRPDDVDHIAPINYDRSQPIGGQAWAFGICMFVKRSSYHVIPSLYQIWYGDDYLVQRNQNIYALITNKIHGHISGTLSQHDEHSEVSQRIKLDTQNAYRFNHFYNGLNWDILTQNRYVKVDNLRTVLEAEYTWARRNASDINENVHLLYELAKQCDSVIEMGVRTGVSTRAFLHSGVKLTSYDLVLDQKVNQLFELARRTGQDARYQQADVLKIQIEPCDLLFIDTLHTYRQLRQELRLHGNWARRYIAFHDTHTFGLQGEFGKDCKGLLTAVIEFVMANPHWRFHTHRTNNNGLTILERISTDHD